MTSPSASASDGDSELTASGPENLRAGFFSIFLPTQLCAPVAFAFSRIRHTVGKSTSSFTGFSTHLGVITGLTSTGISYGSGDSPSV
jgi:hypothetical protein